MNTPLTEKNSEMFSVLRLKLLIQTHISSDYRSWLNTSAAIAGIIFLTSLVADTDNDYFYNVWFQNLIILVGIFFSSRAFLELHDKTRNESFLLIPASSFEKTLARLLVVTVGFVVYVTVLVLLVSMVSELLKLILFGRSIPVFNPFSSNFWQLVGAYFVIQSFYFLGAAWFKKNHLVKTTLTIIGVLLALAIFGMIVVRIFFASYINVDLDFNFNPAEFFFQSARPLAFIAELGVIMLALACWAIAWMRVKETQVSDGV